MVFDMYMMLVYDVVWIRRNIEMRKIKKLIFEGDYE